MLKWSRNMNIWVCEALNIIICVCIVNTYVNVCQLKCTKRPYVTIPYDSQLSELRLLFGALVPVLFTFLTSFFLSTGCSSYIVFFFSKNFHYLPALGQLLVVQKMISHIFYMQRMVCSELGKSTISNEHPVYPSVIRAP